MGEDELENLKRALEKTNNTVQGLSFLIAHRMDRVDALLSAQDELIQALIDSQRQGTAQIWREIAEIKKILGIDES